MYHNLIVRTVDYRVVGIIANIEGDFEHVIAAQLEDEPLEKLDLLEIVLSP